MKPGFSQAANAAVIVAISECRLSGAEFEDRLLCNVVESFNSQVGALGQKPTLSVELQTYGLTLKMESNKFPLRTLSGLF